MKNGWGEKSQGRRNMKDKNQIVTAWRVKKKKKKRRKLGRQDGKEETLLHVALMKEKKSDVRAINPFPRRHNQLVR